MFRTACAGPAGLVPLARRSGQLWHELEQVSGERLFEPTGGLLIGEPDGHLVSGTLEAARRSDLPVEVLTPEQVRREYPAHRSLPDGHVAIREAGAGLVRPEATVKATVEAARASGARVLSGTAVHGIDFDSAGAVLRTATGDLRFGQVVLTAGPWLAALAPELPLEAVRMPTTWFREESASRGSFTLERFPPFLRETGDGRVIWGHGTGSGFGPDGEVKLGLEDDGRTFAPVDADTVDRTVGESDWSVLTGLLPAAVPGLGAAPSRAVVCLTTRTPDRQFVLGRPRGDRRVVLGGGCSGHGFKHAPGIGEVLADLVCGKEPAIELGFAHPDRFA
ncbi:FAD-dependent oxidoreductase [Amycolatopsis sp. A1MSW2902]|uniref:FAD-dependent oxidoreductase n=1 Tax=Amycolatopsis sp. A1MSW2902 TaxID=687413 RepID=UPI00307E89D2